MTKTQALEKLLSLPDPPDLGVRGNIQTHEGKPNRGELKPTLGMIWLQQRIQDYAEAHLKP